MASLVYKGLEEHGVTTTSRNGRVLKFPCPVTMVYTDPLSRCNFTKGRDANPIFHHMESMWMLAGRKDVEFLDMFNSNIHQYSDDGKEFNAAYGYRARVLWGNQLETVIETLDMYNDSRQAVVQLWDALDLYHTTKDKACNMSMIFSIDHLDKVNVIIYNRSNDAVYGGVTGANPVHFSYFLQYVVQRLGLATGNMTFVSNNLHVYLDATDHWAKMDWSEIVEFKANYFALPELSEIERLCNDIILHKRVSNTYCNDHINLIVRPMLNAWLDRKYGGKEAYPWVDRIQSPDLKQACLTWLLKRDTQL